MDGFGDEVRVARGLSATWFSTADVLPRLAASPEYSAVSGKASAFRFDLVTVATPPLLSGAEPMVKVFVKYCHLNLTVPVGIIEPDEVTVAVQVVFFP